MNSKWIKSIGAAVLVAGLTFAYAETAAPDAQHRSGTRQEWRQRRLDRMAAHLNLTEAQKTQAQAIFKESHQAARQFAPQLKQNQEALAQAVKANNAAEIERLSAEQGKLMGKMLAIRTQSFAKMYQTLTPEQRVKADQMKGHFRGMHQRFHGRDRKQG
jgi:Spy/CpxP family protein refolding chaperone